MWTVTGAARRWGRRASNRSGLPSGLVRSGKPYLCRALLLVTRGSLFWIVAVGPEKTAILGLAEGGIAVIPSSYCERATMCAPSLPQVIILPALVIVPLHGDVQQLLCSDLV